MADAEEITVKVLDTDEELFADGKTEKPKPEVVTDPTEELKAQLETLQANTEREKQGRVAAEQREAREREARGAAEREAQTVTGSLTEHEIAAVDAGLSSAKTEADAAEAAIAVSMQEGNWTEVAKQQRRLARAEAESVRLNEAKVDLETTKIAPRPAPQVETRQQEVDPTEAFIASRDTATQAWLRDHADDAKILATNSNPRRAAKINAAHSDAISEGLQEGSKDYFDHVEKFLGMKKEEPKVEKPNGEVQVKAHTRKASSAPVAPINGSGGVSEGGTEVRLSKGEVAAATDGSLVWNYPDPTGKNRFKKGDPIGVEEMARRKAKMTAEGRYDPMNFMQ